MANAEYLPTIGIIGSYRYYSARAPFTGQGDNYFAGAFARWEMFDGLRRRDNNSKAHDKEMEACENLEGFKKDVSFQVFDAYSTAEEKKDNMKLSAETLKSAEEARTRVLKRYTTGSLLEIVDLLNAQTSLNLARLNYITQENDYLDSLTNLSFASGTILKDQNIE